MSESVPEQSPRDITVAIPTYNGANRLPLLFERLKAQANTATLRWEVLVVDNNSQDATATVVKQAQADWRPDVPLRYAFEPRQGAAFARQTAIREATGTLVGFLDDDNLPTPHWVAEAVSFARQYPQAGAFGGRIHAAYESPPPADFDRIKSYLAIRDHGTQVMSFNADGLQLPPAASLVVRRQAWLDCVPCPPILAGKLPGRFIQGDDYEPLLYLHQAGWAILYHPRLETAHQIPPQRFERTYLLTLAKGCGLATCQLAFINTPLWQRPLVAARIGLGSSYRLLRHWLRHRRQLQSDLPSAVLLAFHLGSALSPFYVRRWRC